MALFLSLPPSNAPTCPKNFEVVFSGLESVACVINTLR
jgi:hypothetical protein